MHASSGFRRISVALAVSAGSLQVAGLLALAGEQPAGQSGAGPQVAAEHVELPAAAGPVAATAAGHALVLEPAVPSTTTTVAPPPTITPATTAPPATTPPPPPTTAPPAPAPAPTAPPSTPAPPPPAAAQPLERVQAAFTSTVPAVWRSAIPVRFEIVPGEMSWAYPDGRIAVSEAHARGTEPRLRTVVAHEFGHLIAFRFGSGAFNGAAPTGWPAYSARPEEAWADCVAAVFTGIQTPSHGLTACTGSSLTWTATFLAAGPRR